MKTGTPVRPLAKVIEGLDWAREHCVATGRRACEPVPAGSSGLWQLHHSFSPAAPQVIEGLDWVREHYVAPAVVVMALGGDAQYALDMAVRSLVQARRKTLLHPPKTS